MASRQPKRRELNPISLSFLDVMFCGFGAVILIFLILDYTQSEAIDYVSSELVAEIDLLEEEVREGELGLVQAKNTLSETNFSIVEAQGLALQIQDQIDTFLQELAALENSSLASVEDIARLKADISSLEEELLRLTSNSTTARGSSARDRGGDGVRQQVTGLKMDGRRILIILDSSASMLDKNLANIIRLNLMQDEMKIRAPKWRQAVQSVDWISANLPIDGQYQIWHFNENYHNILEDAENNWLEVADAGQLEAVIETVDSLIPENGTNLYNVFNAAANLDPPPDNMFLITDGLPTLGLEESTRQYISPIERERLFESAVQELGAKPKFPINVILLPLEGDVRAPSAFWELSRDSYGAFVVPSNDWP